MNTSVDVIEKILMYIYQGRWDTIQTLKSQSGTPGISFTSEIEFRMRLEKDFKVFENLELITLRSSIHLITPTGKHYRSCP